MFNQETSTAKSINQSINQSIRRARAYIYSLVVLCFALALAACGGTSSSPGSNSGSISIGTLPNGSTVHISSSGFTASNSGSTTGTLSISGGTSGVSYTFYFSISPSSSPAPTISSSPSPCVMISGSSSQASCQLTFSANGAPESTYTIQVSYESSGASSPAPLVPGKFTFVVTGGSSPTIESGTLLIMPLSVESI